MVTTRHDVKEATAMHVVHPVCCGIDGHQAQLAACLRRVNEAGQITTELRISKSNAL
jgi:hypothetical protein